MKTSSFQIDRLITGKIRDVFNTSRNSDLRKIAVQIDLNK